MKLSCDRKCLFHHTKRRAITVTRATETDYVVIGSGIGGLSCGAVLAKYGEKVTVCEAHTVLGGAAHSYRSKGYHFESGPSLYSDMASRGKDANPLSHVLQAIGEDLELIRYDTWNVLVPEGQFLTRVGADNFCEVLAKIRGPKDSPAAIDEWKALQVHMKPLAKASSMIPPSAIRFDLGALQTAIKRYFGDIISTGPVALGLTGPFSKVIDGRIKDKFTYRYLDLLCFLLSGLPADGTIAAEVAFMFNAWYKPESYLEFPKGGSQALVDALARGVTKRGGTIMTSSHVEEILLDSSGQRAIGVRLRGGETVKANKGVISNASIWDTVKLFPQGANSRVDKMKLEAQATPACNSFMHLHVGFDATGLPSDLELHHIVVNDWEGGVDSPQNVVLISIASVKDPSLAPQGKHCLHAYLPATEPYSIWAGLDRRSEEYKALKEERSQVLWRAVEKIIPDIRSRAEVTHVGTPLTHERFLRRSRGSYGPAIRAGDGLFPGPTTPIQGLYCCGDSRFPGIGLPAAAASGMITANTLVSIEKHEALLNELGI